MLIVRLDSPENPSMKAEQSDMEHVLPDASMEPSSTNELASSSSYGPIRRRVSGKDGPKFPCGDLQL